MAIRSCLYSSIPLAAQQQWPLPRASTWRWVSVLSSVGRKGEYLGAGEVQDGPGTCVVARKKDVFKATREPPFKGGSLNTHMHLR